MVGKVMGIDQVIDGVVNFLGDLEKAYIIDDYAEGKDSGIIDLLLIGTINQNYLNNLIKTTESYINRKIRSLVLNQEEYKKLLPELKKRPLLLVWEAKQK